MAEEWKKLAFYDEVATNFLGLSDTPGAYTTPGAYYKVNAGGDGVEEGLVAGAASGLATLDAGSKVVQDPKLHGTSHKSGGGDEIKLHELGAPTGAVALNSQKITGLATPVAAGDGATKGYVDGVATGLDIKGSCRVATVAVLPDCTAGGSGVGKTLTMDAVGVLTIDGVATVLNDRILVKNQVTGADNGIYKVTTEGEAGVAAVLTRATDFDEDAEVTAGAYSFIEEGTTLADQGWVLTTDNPITVDTTVLTFGQFSSAGGTPAHSSTHENGGGDEISVAGLSGELADNQPPKVHATSHKSAGGDVIKLNEFGNPTAKVPFAGQEGGDFCLENLAADPAPVLGKVYFKTGDLHPYVCTVIA